MYSESSVSERKNNVNKSKCKTHITILCTVYGVVERSYNINFYIDLVLRHIVLNILNDSII